MLYGKKFAKVPCCSLISYVLCKKNQKSSLLQSDFVCCMEKNRKSSLLQSDFVCCMEKKIGKSPCCILISYVVWKKVGKIPCCSLIPYVVWKKIGKSSMLQSDSVCCMEKRSEKFPSPV